MVLQRYRINKPDKLCPIYWIKMLYLWRNLHKRVMDIANNLKKFRSKSNISQQEVADTLGVDRKTYISWESGISDVKSQYIPELAKLFNVEIGELFREKSSDIIINQHNSDNKDNSVNNSIILLVTDKEVVDQLVGLIKEKVEKKKDG